MAKQHNVGFVLFPRISTMCLAIASVFEMANWHLGRPAYRVTLISERGGAVPTSLGNEILTAPFGRGRFDSILVAGEHAPRPVAAGLVEYLRAAHRRGARVGSVCTGAFALAQAGLLDGRRATTHWNHAGSFREQYPRATLDVDRIFTADRGVWTSAGMTAGVDLALAWVDQDFGRDTARATAQLLVVDHRRAGGQSQHSVLLNLDAPSDRVQGVLTFAKQNLAKRLSVMDLATVAFLSPRQFTRLFTAETGESPARAIERLRVEAAQLMMDEGRFSAGEIAEINGFGNRDRMRRSFVRVLGLTPQRLGRALRARGRSMP